MNSKKFELTEEMESSIEKNMSKLTKTNIRLDFDEVASFDFPLDEPFTLEVKYNNTIYCFIIKFSSTNKNLICMGPGAHKRDKTYKGEVLKPPLFDRKSWHQYFEESFIAYADPMLFYDDMMEIGWFIGTENQWYLKDIAQIMEELSKSQDIINENILFFGSSGGGHASVVLGTLLKNSKVLVNNPQLFVLNLLDKRHMNRIFDDICPLFEGRTKDEITEEISYRLDVIELFKKEKYAPYITYYLNVESEGDYLKQALPFFEKVYSLKEFNGLNVIFYREIKEVPHEPMPNDETIGIIRKYCKNYLYNSPQKDGVRESSGLLNEGKYIDDLKNELDKANEENEMLKNQYREIKSSKSWKLTSPLRKLKK